MGQPGLFDLPVTGPDLGIAVYRNHIATPQADQYFGELMAAVPWRHDEIVMYGRKVPVPRLEAWYGDHDSNYSYSGIAMHTEPWTPLLSGIRDDMQRLAGGVGTEPFNSVLVNLYRDGNDGVAWHADDEPELGVEPVIASVSLGASRKFQLRRRDDTSERREIELHHGDVVLMFGLTQALWLHQVPKTSRRVGPRINLTFRTIRRG